MSYRDIIPTVDFHHLQGYMFLLAGLPWVFSHRKQLVLKKKPTKTKLPKKPKNTLTSCFLFFEGIQAPNPSEAVMQIAFKKQPLPH